MAEQRRILSTTDILALDLAVPPGHRHLRCTLHLRGGEELVLPEAAVAAIVRAYVTVKTDPVRESVRLRGRQMSEEERKRGFAEWQLLEEEKAG